MLLQTPWLRYHTRTISHAWWNIQMNTINVPSKSRMAATWINSEWAMSIGVLTPVAQLKTREYIKRIWIMVSSLYLRGDIKGTVLFCPGLLHKLHQGMDRPREEKHTLRLVFQINKFWIARKHRCHNNRLPLGIGSSKASSEVTDLLYTFAKKQSDNQNFE